MWLFRPGSWYYHLNLVAAARLFAPFYVFFFFFTPARLHQHAMFKLMGSHKRLFSVSLLYKMLGSIIYLSGWFYLCILFLFFLFILSYYCLH